MKTCDFLIIGGGIAGLSAAAELSKYGKTLVLEKEESTAYHSSGRSATFYNIALGNEPLHQLTDASLSFFESPPETFTDVQLLKPWHALMVAREEQESMLEQKFTSLRQLSTTVSLIDQQQINEIVPVLNTSGNGIVRGIYDTAAGMIDGDALLQGYTRSLRKQGGQVMCQSEAGKISHRDGVWQVTTAKETYSAPILINAAGAWADHIATLASVNPLELRPKRRTIIIFPAPESVDWKTWPLTRSVQEEFYFLPDTTGILASPADETDTDPCDARPEELDIAIAAHRISEVTTMTVPRILHSWAGLRTFAKDRNPVVGFDPGADSFFFWLAGQGGAGLQTCPAVSQLAASMITGSSVPTSLQHGHLDPQDLSPGRFCY